jgi:4-aminobutyrate aminotransferase-like enzyme
MLGGMLYVHTPNARTRLAMVVSGCIDGRGQVYIEDTEGALVWAREGSRAIDLLAKAVCGALK